ESTGVAEQPGDGFALGGAEAEVVPAHALDARGGPQPDELGPGLVAAHQEHAQAGVHFGEAVAYERGETPSALLDVVEDEDRRPGQALAELPGEAAGGTPPPPPPPPPQ